MKTIFAAILCSVLGACAPTPSTNQEKFEAVPGSIDRRLDTASIEDYIIALPPFAYHEESVEQFAEHVRRSRAEQVENRGKGADYLYVNGDGTWPSKEFVLNRSRRMLTIRIINWEPGFPDTVETMRRVPGGWMRGLRVVMKTGAQKSAGKNETSDGH